MATYRKSLSNGNCVVFKAL